MLPDIDINALPVEERDLVLQLGKISRPFAHDPREPIVKRTLNLYYALAAAVAWEVAGVDCSVWQLQIDWSILKDYIQFAYIRYGYGNDYRDPTAAANAKGARDNKVVYDGYWYLTMKSWSKMVENFYAVRSELGGQMYPDFDLEENGGKNKSELANWVYHAVNNFCEVSKTSIDKTLLYTSPGFYGTNVEAGILKPMQLHIASWTTAPQPTIPKDWAVKGWKFWQWRVGSEGEMPGIKTKIDLNRYNGSRAKFEKEFNVTLPVPTPPSVPAYIKVNTSELNVRTVASDALSSTIIGVTPRGKVWKTTGVQADDAKGRGKWYQVADEHGQVLWLAGWLTVPT